MTGFPVKEEKHPLLNVAELRYFCCQVWPFARQLALDATRKYARTDE
jgi:hypothetical protein